MKKNLHCLKPSIIFIILLLFSFSVAKAEDKPPDIVKPGNYIVEFNKPPVKSLSQTIDKTSHNLFKKDFTALKNRFNGIDVSIRWEYFRVFNGVAIKAGEDIINSIKKLPYVKKVHKDGDVQACLSETVSLIKADKLWEAPYNATGKGITVAVVDTGIDYRHPDLGGGFGPENKVIGGYDFVNNDRNPMDDHGHGTHVAGIIAADGKLKGVAPDAKLL
ncbi:MAG: S8 family serine peptidase, partial [Thermodesulfobacteriota bacterium]|nr:S8 family serine peptidase [Thermodesulfobacteriota bacterium]